MTFKEFASYLQKLEKTSSRLTMTVQLADLFKKLEQSEIEAACYLMQGKLVPKYESLEFNLSVKMLIRVLARLEARLKKDSAKHRSQASPASANTVNLFNESDFSFYETKVWKQYKKMGDLGLVGEKIVESAKLSLKAKTSLNQVYQELLLIAKEAGTGSQERKIKGTVELLAKLDAISAKFVIRIIIGKLRLGFSTMTMIDALSWAKHGNKSDNQVLDEAYQKKADIGKLAKGYLLVQLGKKATQKEIEKFLASYAIEVGVPVMPALCQRLNSAAEIIEKMHEVLAEPKYDGLRVQIHINKKRNLAAAALESDQKKSTQSKSLSVAVFTRNLDNASHMFPELSRILDKINCSSCILDAEAVGIDKKTAKILSFQETITRKRKHHVGKKAETLPIRFYVFDVLAVDDKSLLNKDLLSRKKILKKLFKNNQVLQQTPFLKTTDAEKLRKFHEEQLALGLEGAVIKRIDSVYRSGRKGWRWVKIKEEEGKHGQLRDTLDLLVMGYYRGRGKRASFGMGAFLAGILDKEEKITTIAKIGTGLTDEQLRQMKKRCDEAKVGKKPAAYQVNKNLKPDVWVAPKIVVEIAADAITKSPAHSAGVALRFPRLVKFRKDKGWEDVTTAEEIERIRG
ncbi:MAG: ATP-dependent DNA ligase [Candidatus Woesebacteria bacterium]|jgi:DNA ligase-1